MAVPTPILRHLLPNTPQNCNLIFAPDNSLFHTANGRIQQTNPTRGRSRTLPAEATRNILSLTHAKSLLLTIDEASRATLYRLPSGRVTSRLSLGFRVSSVAISQSGTLAAFVGERFEIWNLPNSAVPEFGGWSKIACFGAPGTCVAFSPDEARIAVSAGRLVTVYTVEERVKGVHVKPLVLHGHRESIVAISFVGKRGLVTISSDGILLCWRLRYHNHKQTYINAKYPFADTPGRNPRKRLFRIPTVAKLSSRHFLKRGGGRSAKCADVRDGMIVVGMSNGVFALFQLPHQMITEDETIDQGLFETGDLRRRKRIRQATDVAVDNENDKILDESIPAIPFTELTVLQTLSVSKGSISHIQFNETGDWLGLSSATGQIVIWDWRAEAYVLKQQAHLLQSTSVAFSPDGSAIATGSRDGQVKIWGVLSGFCVATFVDHSASVSSLVFSAKDVVVSASYDGSVRAFDLRKYQNFRTMVGPPPRRQFACVAVDGAGELVAAGCHESFEVIVWSLRTGQILELLNGHKGPVSGVSFRPRRGTLATSSWDRTIRLWDMYERKGSCEILEHSKEVLDVTFRPDGNEFASCTSSGEIILWDAERGTIVGTVDGARDAAPGRLRDSRTLAPKRGHFKTLCYNADGRFLLAGAASKNVCIYHVSQGHRPTMINCISVTKNQSFDGLVDELNSKNLSSGGHALDTIEDDNEEAENFQEVRRANAKSLPGAIPEEKLKRKMLMNVEVNCVHVCATARLWAAVSAEGVLIYGDAEGDEYGEGLFDPANLEVDITPASAHKAAQDEDYALATTVALRLNERDCLNHVIEQVPIASVHQVVSALPVQYFGRLVRLLAWRLDNTAHLELNLLWARRTILAHGARAHENVPDPSTVTTALRVLCKACATHSKRLRSLIDKNGHMLQYLLTSPAKERSRSRLADSDEKTCPRYLQIGLST